ncbi:TetR/AcrR family transcriptional regulator [Pseudomonas sp. PDNC002]|uniref:TetR/AcrR family transcriptional regulator n=1 Tax=Pseudomonas sp. PDNC002 TaxID=2811422 RepID=UPI00196295D4|nr:TetR/AcrR family transcriptional regulator C-terminal domain-containing protein [Pseudomonas sp. PDNC002]QRY77213.1 TetR/AcrR family transcriptional regulator [Pseudomonas sp. PDNC002]
MPRKKPITEESQSPAREPLTHERIETEALRLIEQEGLEGFSTRRLGTALGCEAMSIYNYFPSKAHILDALVDRVLSTVQFPSRDETAGARLRELVAQWRQLARQHARLYTWLALHRWNSRTGVAFLGEILDCFVAAGLDDEAAARGFRVLGYYVLGATLDEINGYAEGTSSLSPITDEELAEDFPLVSRAGEYFQPEHFDRTFELGLDVLLAGLGIR